MDRGPNPAYLESDRQRRHRAFAAFQQRTRGGLVPAAVQDASLRHGETLLSPVRRGGRHRGCLGEWALSRQACRSLFSIPLRRLGGGRPIRRQSIGAESRQQPSATRLEHAGRHPAVGRFLHLRRDLSQRRADRHGSRACGYAGLWGSRIVREDRRRRFERRDGAGVG